MLVLSHEESSEKGSVTYDLLACNNESVVDRPESSDSSRQPLTRVPFIIYQEPSPPERLCKSSIYRSDFVNYVDNLPMHRSPNGCDRCAERHFLACFWMLLEDNRYIGLWFSSRSIIVRVNVTRSVHEAVGRRLHVRDHYTRIYNVRVPVNVIP